MREGSILDRVVQIRDWIIKPSIVRNSYTHYGKSKVNFTLSVIKKKKKATHLCNTHLPTQVSGTSCFLLAYTKKSVIIQWLSKCDPRCYHFPYRNKGPPGHQACLKSDLSTNHTRSLVSFPTSIQAQSMWFFFFFNWNQWSRLVSKYY